MYKIFKALIVIIWVIDICNIGKLGTNILDTQYTLNTLFWVLVILFIPPTCNKGTDE